jgi:hypothetical protein
MSNDSIYQELRAHLATLRLAAAAEALPASFPDSKKRSMICAVSSTLATTSST